jgi:hypothetical protein
MKHNMVPASEMQFYSCPLVVHRDVKRPTLGFQVVATGTLLSFLGERVIVTAAHVVAEWRDRPLLYPAVQGAHSLPPQPDFSSDKERIDFAAFVLPHNIELHSRFRFLPTEAVAFGDQIGGNIGCELWGYALNRPRGKGPFVRAEIHNLRVHTLAPVEYAQVGLNPKYHLGVGREGGEVRRADSQVVKLPPLRGMSGGPMWLLAGSDKFVLGGITTDNDEGHPVIFGTRASLIIDLIFDATEQ